MSGKKKASANDILFKATLRCQIKAKYTSDNSFVTDFSMESIT